MHERLGISKLVVSRTWQRRLDEKIDENGEGDGSRARKRYPGHPGISYTSHILGLEFKDSVPSGCPPHNHAAVAPAPVKEVAELENTR